MKKTLLCLFMLMLGGCFADRSYSYRRPHNVFNYTDHYEISSYLTDTVLVKEKNIALEIVFAKDADKRKCTPEKYASPIKISVQPAPNAYKSQIKNKVAFDVSKSVLMTEDGRKIPLKFVSSPEKNIAATNYRPEFKRGRFYDSSFFRFAAPEGCLQSGTMFVIDGLSFDNQKLPPVKFKFY